MDMDEILLLLSDSGIEGRTGSGVVVDDLVDDEVDVLLFVLMMMGIVWLSRLEV